MNGLSVGQGADVATVSNRVMQKAGRGSLKAPLPLIIYLVGKNSVVKISVASKVSFNNPKS